MSQNQYLNKCRRWIQQNPYLIEYLNNVYGFCCGVSVFNTGFMNLFSIYSYTHFLVSIYLHFIGIAMIFKEIEHSQNRALYKLIPIYETLTFLHTPNAYACLCLIGGSLCVDYGWFGIFTSLMCILRGVCALRVPMLKEMIEKNMEKKSVYPRLPTPEFDDPENLSNLNNDI